MAAVERVLSVIAMSVVMLFSGASIAQSWPHGPVKICAEDTGWPPFSIPPTSDLDAFKGFNADILATIFNKHKIPYEVTIRPWKRCLMDGKSGDVHIVLDAASNPQRQKEYLLTEPMYELTPGFFFSVEKSDLFPEPVSADKLSDMLVCGQKGYIYSNFGFADEKVEAVSQDLLKVLELTALGRCDIGLARLEVLLTELKHYPKPEQLAYQQLRNTPAEQFYWMLNRNAPFSEHLKSLIDSEMKQLRKEGAPAKMLKAYLH